MSDARRRALKLLQDPELDEAQAEDDTARRELGVARAGAMAGAAISGTNVDSAWDTLTEERTGRVRDYMLRKKEAEGAREAAEKAALSDPGSDVSKRFRAAVAKTLGSVYTPEELEGLTAADKDLVFRGSEMRSTLAQRKEEAARKAAAAEAQAKAGADKLKWEEGQKEKDRAAAMERARLAAGAAGERAAQSAGEREWKRSLDKGARTVGGWEWASPDTPPSTEGAKKMAETSVANDELTRSLGKLQSLYSHSLTGPNAATLRSEWMNITNRLRTLNEMGVPNGADYVMLAQQIENPAEFNNLTTSKAYGLQQLKVLGEQIAQRVGATAKAYGFRRPQGGNMDLESPAPAASGKKPVVTMKNDKGQTVVIYDDATEETR